MDITIRITKAHIKHVQNMYDGITEATSGKDWAQVVDQARNADMKCRGDYPSAEVPMTLVEDLVFTDPKTKAETVVASVGETLGYTPSTTGFKFFHKLFTTASAKYGSDATVRVELSYDIKKNASAPNGYALVTWKLVEEA